MRLNSVLKTMVAAAVVMVWASAAMPACTSSVPTVMRVGDSFCVRVCPNKAYPGIELRCPRNGFANTPILILEPGCAQATTNCNYTCTAITPPAYADLELGGDPYFPDQYYAENNCFYLYLRYGHDNIWYLEIYTKNCTGCFCLTLEDQLPVELSSPLTASVGSSAVTLRWATASENSNERFEIERDGSVAGAVAGLGNSATGRSYSWTDANAENGTTYTYTLVSVDLNAHRQILGSVTATPGNAATATVNEYALYQNYPNPFNPTTRISFDVPAADHVTLRIYNPMGAVVATLVNNDVAMGHHSVEFNAADLTSGLYFYTIQTGEGFTATRKMLLVK